MAGSKNTRNKRSSSPSPFSITLGTSGIIYSLLLIGVIVVWAFILGVVVGRGYEPLNIFSLLHSPSKKRSSSPGDNTNSSAVLKPQQLTFYQGVKSLGQVTQKKSRDVLKAKKTVRVTQKRYFLQVCALLRREDAMGVKASLERRGFRARIMTTKINGRIWYRVYIEEEGGRNKIWKDVAKIKKMGFNPLVKMKTQ